VNRILNLFILLLFISNCSLDTKTGLWSQSEKLSSENENVEEKLFESTEIFEKEFNTDLKIKLKNNFKKNSFVKNLLNNNGVIQFNGKLSKISKYRFSKISQFDYYQPELLITKENTLIFFNEKGTILNFSDNNKLIWKNNIYSKNEKKQNPILYFDSSDQTLIVADSIAKYYAINLKNGELIWSKNNSAPFNSQVKIFKDKFFVIDFDNILRCYAINNGKEIWSFKSEKSFIKSQQKLSFIINDNNLVFINTLGDLSSIDIETGNLVWQTPTQSSAIYENYFSLKNSDLIAENKTIYFSNNKNEFFAIDERNGVIKWKQNLNSNLRPTFADGLVFTVTIEGYLAAIDSRNGNIVRMTNVLNIIKGYKKKNIKPEGFIIANDKIYLSLNNGRLVIIEILNGKPIDIKKIDNEKISRPYILNNNMFIVRDNAIIKLN
jgi:outer membrane protein assembly factor BamB